MKSKTGNVVFKYVGKYKAMFIILFICVIATTFSGSLYPYIFGILVNEVFQGKDMTAFYGIIGLYAGVFVLNQCMHFALNMTWAKLMVQYIYSVRKDMFTILQKLPCKELADRKSGDVIHRINWDSEQFLHYIHQNIFYLMAAVLEFSISMAFVFYINLHLGLLTVVLTPVSVYASRYMSNKIKNLYQERNAMLGERGAWVFEVLHNMTEVKMLGAQRNVCGKYMWHNHRFFRKKIETDRLEFKADQVNKGISLFGQMCLFGLSAFLFTHSKINIGRVISVLAYFDACVNNFNKINKKFVALQENKAGIERCIEILDKETEDYNEDGLGKEIGEGRVTFESVGFEYEEGNPVLRDVNLEISPHETIALVSPSGGGKSTMCMLINKLYETTKGRVMIDGVNVNEYRLSHLRNQVGVVYQENYFFEGSVRFNLIFSEDTDQDGLILHLLEKVNLKAWFDELPNGLDTVIMDGRRTLSGGQKQRLAIARVFIKNPKIIIFDESTASLDSESEKIVREAWKTLFPESTKIIIAHRLSTIRSVNRILVLEDGVISGEGTHHELLGENACYRKLFYEQTLDQGVECNA